MINSRLIFEERSKELEAYICFLESIEKLGARISFKNSSDVITIDSNIKNILKANVYLLTYNMVEATVRNIFVDIYENIKLNSIRFEELSDKFKLQIIKDAQKNFKTITLNNINEKILNLSKDIIHETFDVKNAFNGNVDAKLIKERIEHIGISLVKTRYSGSDLLSIKEQRNSLAHGEQSFGDCGRDLLIKDMKLMLDRTKQYMEMLLDCSEEYISKQLYRKTSPKKRVRVVQ